MKIIYFDHNATTPVDAEVLETMLPYFTKHYGNASSKTHAFGWIAEQAVKTAQEQVANLIQAYPEEIFFTSGATESINTALKGLCNRFGNNKNHIISAATEHEAVLDNLKKLQLKGFEVTLLPVNHQGQINLELLDKTFTSQTFLVCLMFANNETGTLFPIKEIAEITHKHGALLFCDATQAVGKVEVNVIENGIDILCLSAHKMYGPKGVGALYIKKKRPRINIQPLIDGGGHQNGMRSGTLNVPGIVGLGKACDMIKQQMTITNLKIAHLRNLLEEKLTLLPNTYIHGDVQNRLANTSNIGFKNKSAADLIRHLKKLAVSMGSACTSEKASPSHVLMAMGFSESEAQSSIRFSLGKHNTIEEVKAVIEMFNEIYQQP